VYRISVFVSQLGKGGSWEFKRQAGNILGVGNLGALASRIAWELGGRVGAQKSSLGAPKKVEMEKLEGKITVPAPFGDSNRLPFESCNLECLSFTLGRWLSTGAVRIVQYMYTGIQNPV